MLYELVVGGFMTPLMSYHDLRIFCVISDTVDELVQLTPVNSIWQSPKGVMFFNIFANLPGAGHTSRKSN